MLGHSRGHTAVAIRDGDGWLLHCGDRGDTYFHRGRMAEPPTCPSGLRAFQRAMAADNDSRLENTERLRELAREHGDEVRLFCAHDKVELERALSASDRAA
jgi:glyoxylase-like metal-dependent hydrolase (beta-lactamase superfamily II)